MRVLKTRLRETYVGPFMIGLLGAIGITRLIELLEMPIGKWVAGLVNRLSHTTIHPILELEHAPSLRGKDLFWLISATAVFLLAVWLFAIWLYPESTAEDPTSSH